MAITTRRRQAEGHREVHRADLLEEMVIRHQFPGDYGLKFSQIIDLANKRELLELVGEDKIKLLW